MSHRLKLVRDDKNEGLVTAHLKVRPFKTPAKTNSFSSCDTVSKAPRCSYLGRSGVYEMTSIQNPGILCASVSLW